MKIEGNLNLQSNKYLGTKRSDFLSLADFMSVYTACFILNYIFFIEISDFDVVKQRMFYFRRFVFMYWLDKKNYV